MIVELKKGKVFADLHQLETSRLLENQVQSHEYMMGYSKAIKDVLAYLEQQEKRGANAKD